MRAAHAGGIAFFQYRSKAGSRRSIYETSLRLARTAAELHASFIVNDHADIALAVSADGVHLGQDDLPIELARTIVGPNRIIGISTHNHEEAVHAQLAGADYIGFGSVFPTETKSVPSVQGLSMLENIRKAVSIPIIAIGGIKLDKIGDIAHAGADGVAVISAILAAHGMEGIEKAAREMTSAWTNERYAR